MQSAPFILECLCTTLHSWKQQQQQQVTIQFNNAVLALKKRVKVENLNKFCK